MQSLGKVQVPQTNQNNQSCLLNIIIKPLPLLCAATTSPCLMLLNHYIRSPPKLVRITLPYPCYTQSTSHTHINPVEATHPSFLLQIPTMYSGPQNQCCQDALFSFLNTVQYQGSN